MKTLTITLDDFYYGKDFDGLSLVEGLVKRVPNIKLTLFTIPRYHGVNLNDSPAWCDRVRRLVEARSVELGVHGYYHISGEFGKIGAKETHTRLFKAAMEFKAAGLPFKKIFKAPNGVISDPSRHALAELGYTHIFVNEHTISETILEPKQVMYTWNIKLKPGDAEHHITYGHVNDVCGNGLKQRQQALVDCIREHRPTFTFGSEL